MHKMWKRYLAVSLCALLLLSAPMGANIFAGFALTASAASYSGTCGENLTWTLDTETGIFAISGIGKMEDYNWDGAPWYSNSSSIREVQIADSVTSIGNWALSYCENLTSITIPDSVTSIGDCAFYVCTSLTSVNIPDSVTSIESSAFQGCMSLTSITVDANNPSYSGDSQGALFDKDKSTLIQCPGALTEYTIPDSVTSIEGDAFSHCTNLTSVTIPDSVTSIGDYAFYWCKGLTNVTIPDSVTYIGGSAFSGCTSLTSATVPDSVTRIGWG
ncbi:MAG: leucine-rich repeat domain-containing protein, partial [Acutalibacteraceae bacterium]